MVKFLLALLCALPSCVYGSTELLPTNHKFVIKCNTMITLSNGKEHRSKNDHHIYSDGTYLLPYGATSKSPKRKISTITKHISEYDSKLLLYTVYTSLKSEKYTEYVKYSYYYPSLTLTLERATIDEFEELSSIYIGKFENCLNIGFDNGQLQSN